MRNRTAAAGACARRARPGRTPAGAARGTLTPAVITAQVPANQPSAPGSPPGPLSMPAMRSVRTSHPVAGAARTPAITRVGIRYDSACGLMATCVISSPGFVLVVATDPRRIRRVALVTPTRRPIKDAVVDHHRLEPPGGGRVGQVHLVARERKH